MYSQPANVSSEETAMAETWMRVVIYRSHSTEESAGAEYLRTSTRDTLRLLEGQPGFKLGYWGHNPSAGEMAAVTYWESLDSIRAAGPVLQKLQSERDRQGIRVTSARNMRLMSLSQKQN
jgi:heme-degrading monooxygenase HmoA